MCLQVNLMLQFVSSDPCPDLHQEDDAEEHSEGEGHAVVFLNGAAAPEEGDKEDNAAHDNQEHGGGEELVSEEVEILGIGPLNNSSSHNQKQTRELHRLSVVTLIKNSNKHRVTYREQEVKEEECVLDALDAGLHGAG